MRFPGKKAQHVVGKVELSFVSVVVRVELKKEFVSMNVSSLNDCELMLKMRM